MSTRKTIRIRRSALSSKRQAFTLIEILVVLAIATIVTAITVGGFNEMRAGNKRTSCQTNLVQIYQAARQYASDEGGRFPFYNFSTVNNCNTTAQGIGLWQLYTFPNAGYTAPDIDKPIERYIRSGRVLHCPNHNAHRSLIASGTSLYDVEYLSYQACDNGIPTYASVRTTDPTNAFWQRQLLHRNNTTFVPRLPSDNTVVTWCMHHRNPRNMDNVLFYDGSVQLMPKDYGGAAEPWQREPKPPA